MVVNSMTVDLNIVASEKIKTLKSVLDEIKDRFTKIYDEIETEFNLDTIKSTAKYCLDRALLDVEEIIYNELEKLNWINIIIDCGEIENELDEIKEIILLSRDNISNELNQLPEFVDLKINLNQITRKIHLQLPITWGNNNIENLFQRLFNNLKEKDIVPV